jgi:ATP-dependent DNA helicase RecQ
LRKEIADEVGVPAYVIFSDRALQEMATYYPQTETHFLAMNGVGQVKLERYGQRFLDLIRGYCQPKNLPERPKALPASARSRSGSKRRFEEVGEFFLAGQSVAELQKMYGVKRDTIIAHLQRYRNAGHPLPADRILAASSLTPEQQEEVLAQFQQLGTDYLSPIYEALEQSISYDELHIMRLYLLCGGEFSGTQPSE